MGVGQPIHDGRFASVGITHQAYVQALNPSFFLGVAFFFDSFDFIAKFRNPASQILAIIFNLLFPSTTGDSNTTTFPVQMFPESCESRHQKFCLGQFNLKFGFPCTGITGKYFKYHLGPVQNRTFPFLLKVTGLFRSQGGIHDYSVCTFLMKDFLDLT